MQFALAQSSHLGNFNRELSRIFIEGPIPRWMGRMGLVPRRSLYAICTDIRTLFLTSTHPQVFVNMQFALVQSTHMGVISRELTKNSIGGAIPRLIERMGLVARRSWYAVCTLFAQTEGPHL